MIISFLACILLSDYLVRSGPIEIYINNDSIIGDPDGSLLKPYRTLLDAFESNSNSNVEF